MDDIKAKQQVVEKIKEASKILVTVSDSPSVDALSAALGLTLLFDKQEKYATAIFSGEVPPAIAFLEPEKTFDETTDSLRDFIIALNKEKADHLRYKVEGDSVKIFITPYKTTIAQDDLEFSQGDYNVELVIALGVDSQEHLDRALEEHGQILHDATVITVSAGDQTSNLGGIDWHDANASSLSEMIAGLGEALKDDKKKSYVDAPIATALLTGIVAETERFSNEHTTSRAMTVAAQLMSAGADQQLIATELQAPEPTPEVVEETEQPEIVAEEAAQPEAPVKKDELKIVHEAEAATADTETKAEPETETLAELDERVRTQEHDDSTAEDEAVKAAEAAVEQAQETAQEEASEPEVAETLAEEPASELAFEETTSPQQQYNPEVPALPEIPSDEPDAAEESTQQPAPTTESVANVYALNEKGEEPAFGGTLNATSEQAADDARREAESDQNKTILSHAYIGNDTANDPTQVSNPLESNPAGFPGTPENAPGSVGINEVPEEIHSAYAAGENNETIPTAQTFGISGEKVLNPLAPAPAVDAPADFGLPLPPPLPDFSQGPLAPPAPLPVFPSLGAAPVVNQEPVTQTEILGDILAPEPTSAYSLEAAPVQPPSNDPGQFKIPT